MANINMLHPYDAPQFGGPFRKYYCTLAHLLYGERDEKLQHITYINGMKLLNEKSNRLNVASMDKHSCVTYSKISSCDRCLVK